MVICYGSHVQKIFPIFATACVSLVGVVTVFSSHLCWYGSHDGPCHQRSRHLLIPLPQLPKSAGFSLVPTCLHWMFRTRLLTNCFWFSPPFDPVKGDATVKPTVDTFEWISFQHISHIAHQVGCHMPSHQLESCYF